MIKKHWKLILSSSVVVLLPMLAGLLLWNRLPDSIATHFNSAGAADGWSSKTFTVLGLPCILLLVHLLCTCTILADPKRSNIGEKGLTLVMWIVPAVSVFVSLLTYPNALGLETDIPGLTSVFIGVILIVTGCFLPKCKQNYTVGLKLPWTLHDEENWDKTHKLAGKTWIAGGAVFIVSNLISIPLLGFIALAASVLIPTVYSYLLYRKKNSST